MASENQEKTVSRCAESKLHKMDYDRRRKAVEILVNEIEKWIPDPAKAKAGILSDDEDNLILKAYEAAGITDVTVTSDKAEFSSQVFDVLGMSCVNTSPDEAFYLVYDLFKRRRFSGTSLLCTNVSGESMAEYLEERIRRVLSQNSAEGFFMNIPRENRNYVRSNIGNLPLTSTLLLCSRPDYKLVSDILDIDYEPEPKPEWNLPSATQVRQQGTTDSAGRTARARAIQCTVEQGEQLIYASFSNKPLPYTVQDADNFCYRDGDTNVCWDIILISDCARLVEKGKSLIKGKDPQGGYVINGSGKDYGVNLRKFSELAKQYDGNLKRVFSLMRMLGERRDITLPSITFKEAKELLQEGIPPETIVRQYDITPEQMRGLRRFYVEPRNDVVAMSESDGTDANGGSAKSNTGGTDGDEGSSSEDESIVEARALIAKGVLLYDSDIRRLLKNASRIQGVDKLKATTHIRSIPGSSSLESSMGCGAYVMNSYDDKCKEALDRLLELYLDSGETLDLVFLGDGFDECAIREAIELEVDVNYTHVPVIQAYIDEKQPVNLETVVASML